MSNKKLTKKQKMVLNKIDKRLREDKHQQYEIKDGDFVQLDVDKILNDKQRKGIVFKRFIKEQKGKFVQVRKIDCVDNLSYVDNLFNVYDIKRNVSWIVGSGDIMNVKREKDGGK